MRGSRSQLAILIVLAVVGVATTVGPVDVLAAFETYRIPTDAMAPTIEAGDRILVREGATPHDGDLVTFNPPEEEECEEARAPGQMCATPGAARSGATYVKRVVAGPGDRVALEGGRVIRDGRRVAEAFVGACRTLECHFPVALTV